MNLTVKFESGEPGVNYRKFEIDACFMEPAADTIAPLLIHLADLLTSQHPADIMEIVPHFVPELAQARVREHREDGGR